MYVYAAHFFIFQRPSIQTNPITADSPKYGGYQLPTCPAMSEKKIVICDRFTDSTTAYQVYGKKVNYKFIENIHKQILGNLKPNLTFVLRVKISKALKRMNKRKSKNRYDKLSKSFYTRAQNAFIKIAKKNTKRYFMIDNSKDSNNVENIILNKFIMSYQNANRSS